MFVARNTHGGKAIEGRIPKYRTSINSVTSNSSYLNTVEWACILSKHIGIRRIKKSPLLGYIAFYQKLRIIHIPFFVCTAMPLECN